MGEHVCHGRKSNWEGYPVKTERCILSSTGGVCKDLFLPGGLGMLSGIKHLQGQNKIFTVSVLLSGY